MTRQQFVRNTLEAVRAQADSVETTATPGLLFGPEKTSAEPTGLHSDASSIFGNREAGASRASLDQSSRYRRSFAERAPEDSPSSSSLNLPASPAMSRSTTTTSARASDTPIRASLRSDSALTVNSAFSQRSFETSLQGLLKASKLPSFSLPATSGALTPRPPVGHVHRRQIQADLPAVGGLEITPQLARRRTLVSLARTKLLALRHVEPEPAATDESPQLAFDHQRRRNLQRAQASKYPWARCSPRSFFP